MAALRTDYEDDMFTGSRKYNIVNNQDGSVSFTDVTEYINRGDTYGAAQINELNAVINEKGIVVSNTAIDVQDRMAGNLYFFY